MIQPPADPPAEIPPAADRAAWRELARRIDGGRGPPGWKVHRPEIGVFVAGAVVFGAIGVVAVLAMVHSGSSACTLIAAVLCLGVAGLSSGFLALSPRLYVVLSPGGILYSRPVQSPVWIPWEKVVSVELGISKNPRETRENYGVVFLRYETPSGEPGKLWIDAFSTGHVRVLHAEISEYRKREIPDPGATPETPGAPEAPKP